MYAEHIFASRAGDTKLAASTIKHWPGIVIASDSSAS